MTTISFSADSTVIPAKTQIILFPLEIHTNKKSWGEDAMKFIPERFMEENIKNVHPYAYIPFSNGPRICPGYKYAQQVLKVFLAKFLLKYRVTSEMEYEKLELQVKITTEIKQGYMMKVEPRC